MSAPKEIAEMIINQNKFEQEEFMWLVHNSEVLAHAYLELEKKYDKLLSTTSASLDIDIAYTISSLDEEIVQLKSEKAELENKNLSLTQAVENYHNQLNLSKSSLRCGQCGNIGMFHHGIIMADEITKLKKSREVLRKACEFYASSDQWNCTKEQLTTYNTIDKDDLGIGDFQFACDVDDDRVGGKKAREALKADDELIGDGE